MTGFDGKTEHYSGRTMAAADVIDDFDLGFNLGNATKYVLRCGRKGGPDDAIRDLEKASAYIERELTKRRGGATSDDVAWSAVSQAFDGILEYIELSEAVLMPSAAKDKTAERILNALKSAHAELRNLKVCIYNDRYKRR